jgi:hypothetical protein
MFMGHSIGLDDNYFKPSFQVWLPANWRIWVLYSKTRGSFLFNCLFRIP